MNNAATYINFCIAFICDGRNNKITRFITKNGIIITRMSRDGPAFRAGIRVGDVISKIDGIPTPDMARFLTLLWSYEVGDEVETEYISNNEFKVTVIELTERPAE